MTIPAPDTPAPARVRELAAGATLTPVWANEAGGLTFRTDDGRYIKHGPRSLETPIAGEVARLTWAAAYTPVPRVIASGQDAADEWLVTAAIEGDSAVAPRWIANAETAATAVRAVGEGLRALHDALPVDDCPFDWTAPTRIANAAARGIRVPASLQDAPPVDVAVVCHGDACCPNTLLDSTGAWTGHVDLIDEHRVELRPGLGGRPHRRLRHRPRPRPHRVLPRPLERDLIHRAIDGCDGCEGSFRLTGPSKSRPISSTECPFVSGRKK
jgi:kanamycin kinase